MNGVNSLVFLSCQKAGEFVEKNLHSQLGLAGKLRLSLHLSLCGICRAYSKQSRQLEQMIRSQIKSKTDVPDQEWVDDVKLQILEKTSGS